MNARLAGLGRIVIDGDDARVYTPLSARPVIRSMPLRRFDYDLRAWLVPAADVPELHRRLDDAGYLVRVLNPAAGIRPRLILRRETTA